MVDWLEKFAQGRSKSSMKKTASKIIVDKETFPDAKDEDVVEYDSQSYKVVNSNYEDDGILLEKCSSLESSPMEVEVGTAPEYKETQNEEQEYARFDSKFQSEDPRDEEVKKFNEEAEETVKEIETEDSIDGTRGDTRPNRILQRMFESYLADNMGEGTPMEDLISTETEELPLDSEPEVTEESDNMIDLEDYDFDDPENFDDESEEDEVVESCDDRIGCNTKDIEDLKNEFKSCSNKILNKFR